MQIECKNGVSYSTKTMWLKDSQILVGLVFKHIGQTRQTVYKFELNTHGLPLARVRGQVYRLICRSANVMAANNA